MEAARVVVTAAGLAARRESLLPQDTGQGQSLAGLTVAYHVPDPRGAGAHSITMHASLPEAAIVPVRAMFDAVGASFHFLNQERAEAQQEWGDGGEQTRGQTR